MTPVEMPKANENMTEATLDRWLVKEGQFVAKDQGLCEIITDKAKFDMPAPVAGTVLKILAPERAVLPVGYVLCVIGAASEPIPADFGPKNEQLLAAHRSAATSISAPGASLTVGAPVSATGAIRATPAARRAAKEAGVDLAAVAAALKICGVINEKDIKTFLERGKP